MIEIHNPVMEMIDF